MKRGRNVLAEQPGLPGVARTNFWTPDDLYNELNAKYGPFTVDAAADESNAKCAKYFDESQDGRFQEWTGRVWCNPPYKDLITWVRKAYESTVGGGCEIAVILIPAHTSTAWFHDYALPFAELHWIRGKRRFGGLKDSAIMPSVAVVFMSDAERARRNPNS